MTPSVWRWCEGNLVFSLQAVCSQNRFPSNGLILTLEVNKLISRLSLCTESTILVTQSVSHGNNGMVFLTHTIIICLRASKGEKPSGKFRRCLWRTCPSSTWWRAEGRQSSNKIFYRSFGRLTTLTCFSAESSLFKICFSLQIVTWKAVASPLVTEYIKVRAGGIIISNTFWEFCYFHPSIIRDIFFHYFAFLQMSCYWYDYFFPWVETAGYVQLRACEKAKFTSWSRKWCLFWIGPYLAEGRDFSKLVAICIDR